MGARHGSRRKFALIVSIATVLVLAIGGFFVWHSSQTIELVPANAPMDEKLVAAWRAVKERKSRAELNGAKALFQSALEQNDPVMANQGTAGLAEVESIVKWGGIRRMNGKEGLWPVCLEPRGDRHGPTANSKHWGWIDHAGREVIRAQWDRVWQFSASDEFAKVEKDGKHGFIDRTGKEVISLRADEFDLFTEGMAPTLKDNGWVFIDRTGKEVIPSQWDHVEYFSEGLAPVAKTESGVLLTGRAKRSFRFSGISLAGSAPDLLGCRRTASGA